MTKNKSSQSIFIIGFPKSGNTWLTRLLADSLQIRAGTGMRGEDQVETATSVNFQLELPEITDFIVRKTHYLPSTLMEVRNEDINRSVYIYRDFRDVVISSFFYLHSGIHENGIRKDKKNSLKSIYFILRSDPKRLLLEHTETISRSWSDGVGSWSNHINTWQDFCSKNPKSNIVFVSYEGLLNNTLETVKEIIEGIQLPLPPEHHLKEAIRRQSFQKQKSFFQEISNDTDAPFGKDFNIKFLRKGIAGDWKNFFTKEMGEIVEEYHGEMLRKLGYVKDSKWYQKL